MQFHFIGRTNYKDALAAQSSGVVLGFEPEPIVTLGIRATDADFLWDAARLAELGYSVERIDRGGQATIHNPGQLVIFPSLDVRPFGARQFVNLLIQSSRRFLLRYGIASACRKEAPGLYTERGKIMSIGLRIHRGIAYHGISINVRNDLSIYQSIRVCGVGAAQVDRMNVEQALSDLFLSWSEEFKAQLTSEPFSTNLVHEFTDVRS